MSEIVHFKGTLHKIEILNGKTLEEQCKRILGDKELPDYYDSYEEMITDVHYLEYVINNNSLYSVKKNIDEGANIFNISKDKNGTINFEVRYYNGSRSFTEAMERAFYNYNEKDIEPLG